MAGPIGPLRENMTLCEEKVLLGRLKKAADGDVMCRCCSFPANQWRPPADQGTRQKSIGARSQRCQVREGERLAARTGGDICIKMGSCPERPRATLRVLRLPWLPGAYDPHSAKPQARFRSRIVSAAPLPANQAKLEVTFGRKLKTDPGSPPVRNVDGPPWASRSTDPCNTRPDSRRRSVPPIP
jgi:hypothetical protein